MLKLIEEVRLQKKSWDVKMTELPVNEEFYLDADCRPAFDTMVRFYSAGSSFSADLQIRKWGGTTLTPHQPSMLIAGATFTLGELTQLHAATGQAIDAIQHNVNMNPVIKEITLG